MRLISILSLIVIFSWGCAGTSSKSRSNNISSSSLDQEDDDQEDSIDQALKSTSVSGASRIYTYSLSNSPLSSKRYSPKKARDQASRIRRDISSGKKVNQKDLVALMSMQRMSGGDLQAAFSTAKRIVMNEMKVDIARDIPESAVLELALSAIQAANYSMADHWLNVIAKSKDKKMRAAERTARGIIEVRSDRLPEAIVFWYDALKLYSNYEPAKLNIGFYALKYGDYQTAKKMLSTIRSNYFTLTGLMQAERLADRAKKVDSMCKQIISKEPKYKPALFSCALNSFQGLGQFEKAKQELEKVAQVEGPPVEIDEKSFLTIGKLDKARAKKAAAARQQKKPEPAKPAKPAK
ncbi:MAG: hypothetical protein HRU19_31285 [Pseudobacteriovorax sp.]|nr:hypothetical protein [Pseudobacteriovorax sp.]